VAISIFLLIPAFGNNYYNHVVIQMMFFAYLGTAWNIMGGYTGQLSFGHATFFGLGAYTSTLLFINLGITPWVGMLIGGGVAFAVGAGIGFVGFRYGLRGVFFAFVTLSAAEIFRLLTLLAVPLTKGAEGILLPWKGHNPLMFSFSVDKKYLYYYTMLVMALAALLVAYWIKKTRFGYYLAAIRENEDAAEALGINAPKLKILAIGISAFFTALGGTFYAQYYQHFEPFETFGPMRSFEIIFPVIIGGGGHVLGPPIGAILLQFFEEASRALIPPLLLGFHRILYGAIIVAMIIFLPAGVVGLLAIWKDRIVAKYNMKQ
jgi:branched-chain amino acid transport system permease protein